MILSLLRKVVAKVTNVKLEHTITYDYGAYDEYRPMDLRIVRQITYAVNQKAPNSEKSYVDERIWKGELDKSQRCVCT